MVMAILILIIETYIYTFQLWYNYKLEQRPQIITKLKWQVICIFNIIVGDTQKQVKLVYNLYKDSLDNILNSNIDNIMAKTIHTKPRMLR